MKALIAVSSCERDALNGFNDAMRETWIRALPSEFEYRIFTGRTDRQLFPDEIALDVEDDYHSLPFKTRSSLAWALDHGFEFIFRAFSDTCIHPRRLSLSGFQQFDYLGHFPGGYAPEPDRKGNYAYCSGGPGYWLSWKAAEAVVLAQPDHWAEDLWVGNVMGRNGIRGVHDPRYYFKWSRPRFDTISVHLSRGTNIYQPQWMRECYAELCRA